MKLLAAVLAFAVSAGLLVACSSAGPALHAGQVNASQGGSIALAGAKLSVPPGAVSGSGQLTATTAGAPPPIQPTGTGRVALSGASAPVRFSLTGARVIKPVGVTFRVRPITFPSGVSAASEANAVWLSFYDPASQRWQAVASQYDPATGSVSAQAAHLSWWMAWTWDWAGIALRIRQALYAFGSGRAPPVSCARVPQVTVTSLGEPDAPLIGCPEQAGSGTLTVSLTNNRGLTVVMSGVPADATPGPVSYSGLDAYLSDTAFRQALTARLGGAILPHSETLTYTVPLHGPAEAFTAAATVQSVLLDLTLTAGEEVFGKVTKDYATCAFNTVLRSQVPSLADVPGLATSCLPVLAEESPALQDLAKALGKRFFVALTLLLFDVKTLLQDYDLYYDAFRRVSGLVEIHRPAVVSLPLPEVAFCLGPYPDCTYQYHGIEPTSIYFSGDNTVSIRGLTWSSWKETSAAGSGTWYYVDCNPDCASGPVTKYPATVTLSNVQNGLFTVLTTTLQGKATTYDYTSLNWPQSAEGCQQSPTCNEAPGSGSSG